MSEVISLIEDFVLPFCETWTRLEMQKEFPVTRITLQKKSLVCLFVYDSLKLAWPPQSLNYKGRRALFVKLFANSYLPSVQIIVCHRNHKVM